jgi:hypothetical protein
MAIFKYTLPSGANYTVETPTGYTQEQADYVFYSQVASGSLVGYTSGQQLSSINTKLTKFGLSRLERGTAGVDLATILAIAFNSPVIAKTPNLSQVALQNPINSADYSQAGTPLGVTPVGPLTTSQTQAILAQVVNLVDQDANTVSTNKGVGQYGFTPNGLEQAGYLKPGTSNYPDYNCVVGTPEVWTGKNGVYSLASVLGNPATQGQIQTEIMQNGYDALTASGTIQTTPEPPVSLAQGQVYTTQGLSSLSPVALIAGAAAASGSLNGLVTSAIAGTKSISGLLANANTSLPTLTSINSLLSQPITNISTLASGAVNDITQGLTNLPTNVINSANNLVTNTLNSLTGEAGALVNSLTTTVGSSLTAVNSLVSGISNGIAQNVGSLVTNASQFGSQLTSVWAEGGGALTTALGSVNSALTGAVDGITSTLGSATTALSGAMGDLTNIASTALGELSGQASSLVASLGGSLDAFGKMGSFSIDFSLFSTDSLVSATKVAAGYSNTVDRQTVDAAVSRILGNSKIPVPQFEFPSVNSLNLGADIQFAKNVLNSLTSQATQLYNQGTQIYNQGTQLVNQGTQIVNNVQRIIPG